MGRNNQNDRQRQLMTILPKYALRKTKFGCVSVLIAIGFFLGSANGMTAKADALSNQDSSVKAAVVQSDHSMTSASTTALSASMNTWSEASNAALAGSFAVVGVQAATSASSNKLSTAHQDAAVTENSAASGASTDSAVSDSAVQDQQSTAGSQSVADPKNAAAGSAVEKSASLVATAGDSPSIMPAEDVTVNAKNFSQYFNTDGTATYECNPDGSVTITFTKKDQQYSAGAVSLKEKINMDSSFTLNGQINLGNFGGADGMGIVFHTGSVNALGRPGGNLGIAGLPNAVGFKLDSYYDYYNEPTSDLPGDEIPLPKNGEDDSQYGQSQDPTTEVPYGDIVTTSHIKVPTTEGKPAWRWWVDNQDGTVKPLTTSLMDGKFHDFSIHYDGTTHTLTITLAEPAGHLNDNAQTPEQAQTVTWTCQIPNLPNNENIAMGLNIIAATGELTNLQQFKLTSFTFSPAASVNVEYLNEQGQQIHQAGVHYSGAPVIGDTYSTNQLNLPGYTYIGLGKGSLAPSGTLEKEGLNGTVIYVYGRTEKITVNYQDVSEENPHNLSSYDQNLSGARGQSSGYSTTDTIEKLEAKGYQLVNDPTGGKILDYGNAAQSYTVKLKHRKITLGPDQYQNNGTPLPNDPSKTYKGVEKNDLNQTTTRTIKYEFANGSQAYAPVKQSVDYTRSATVDEVTGDVDYTPWTVTPTKYPQKDSPVIPGYDADTPVVDAAAPAIDENPVVKVIYQPCTEKIRIVYEDVSAKDPQSLSQYDKVLTGKYGSSADYSTADTIKALERQGYQLVSDPTDGQVLSFNNTSERTYVIKLKHQSANTDHHAGGSVKPPMQKPTDTQGKGTASTTGSAKTAIRRAKRSQSWQPVNSQTSQSVQARHTVTSNETSSAIQLTKSNKHDAVSAPNETASTKHLPQTGNRRDGLLADLGLLLAGIGSWLGFDEIRKRVLKRDDR
ncbi:MucBP domain-containing protein [Limosilactobacillus allomucosae]|uniref:MucBP domain-containing protein n=1 Tax=Limosilactobacillus allomucosae TaxID=3142938 RepID=A0AAU7C5G5_9LACO